MRAIGLLFIVVCAKSLSVSAQGVVDEDNPALAIRALEHEWVEGQSRNDNRALDLIFDNALVYIEYGKLMTKGQYLSRVRSAGPYLPQQIVNEAMTVRAFGSTVIVVGTYREKGVQDRKTLLRHWRFIDTWVKKRGKWMLVAAASSPLSE
ncbi:MAG: nuclear transport factor 2 family protein [Candidatus Sulfotelmatobacter sp.]